MILIEQISIEYACFNALTVLYKTSYDAIKQAMVTRKE